MRLKILPLTSMLPMGFIPYGQLPYFPETTPIFNRDGAYLFNGLCWIELNGKAYDADPVQFMLELEMMNASEHRPENAAYIEAAMVVTDKRLLSEQIVKEIYFYRCLTEIREIQKRSKKSSRQMLKRLQHIRGR